MPLPIDQEKDVAVGLSLPLQSGNNGYFQQTFTTMEQVKSNVINLLLTIPGERYMQPTFGSNLYSHLFEQFDEFVEEQIEDSIKEALKRWLPYVIIESLDVTDGGDLTNEDSYHTIKVSLTISITADPETFSVITFKALETVNVIVTSERDGISDGTGIDGEKTMVEIYKSVNRWAPR